MLARPDPLPLFAIPLDENGFVDWLIDAKPGDTLVYYRGHLSHDRMDGPCARRKFWQNFTVAGGKRDEKGESIGWNIAKSSFRAMIDSAVGLDPKDESPAARNKRKLEGLCQLDGIVFAARIMVEPRSDGNAAGNNRIANIVLPGEPEYARVMAGQAVPPDPVNALPRKPRAGAGPVAPAWSQQASAPQHNAEGPSGAPAAAPAPSSPQWLNS